MFSIRFGVLISHSFASNCARDLWIHIQTQSVKTDLNLRADSIGVSIQLHCGTIEVQCIMLWMTMRDSNAICGESHCVVRSRMAVADLRSLHCKIYVMFIVHVMGLLQLSDLFILVRSQRVWFDLWIMHLSNSIHYTVIKLTCTTRNYRTTFVNGRCTACKTSILIFHRQLTLKLWGRLVEC